MQAGFYFLDSHSYLLSTMKSHWLRTDLCSIMTGEVQKVQHQTHPRDGGGVQENDGVRCGVRV